MGVSVVVPRMTLTASFSTLSNISRLDCDRAVGPSFDDSICVLCASILFQRIPGYLRQFVQSVTSLLKDTACIACSIALLLRMHHSHRA